MNAKELHLKSVDELNAELEALTKSHFSMRMQKAMQQFNKTSEFKVVRRNIARIKTILREKAK